MPKYLALGTLTQEGYENMEAGPETVEQFMDQINAMGGNFNRDDFFILNGEYQHAGIVEFPSQEAAAQVVHTYARSGRGRLQLEPIIATGPDGYEEYVSELVE